jgi:Lar family restriction alleviation protein
MTEELLPCPFCGSDEAEVVSPYDGQLSDYGTVKCYKCECNGPLVDMVGGYWKPIKAWNTRAQPKYKRVDLGLKRESVPIDYKDGSHREWEIHNAAFNDGWNEAIDDIKSKYGDLFIEIKE